MKFITPSEKSIFNCQNLSQIKLITRFQPCFSHFPEHKLRQNFQDNFNPTCSFEDNTETTTHNSLHCPNYLNEQMVLLSNLQHIEKIFLMEVISNSQRCCFFGDSLFNHVNTTTQDILKDLMSPLHIYECFGSYKNFKTYLLYCADIFCNKFCFWTDSCCMRSQVHKVICTWWLTVFVFKCVNEN